MIKKKNTFNFSLNPHVSIRSFSCFREIKNTFNFSLNIFFIKYQDLKEKNEKKQHYLTISLLGNYFSNYRLWGIISKTLSGLFL